jgi:hypothetical protein
MFHIIIHSIVLLKQGSATFYQFCAEVMLQSH